MVYRIGFNWNCDSQRRNATIRGPPSRHYSITPNTKINHQELYTVGGPLPPVGPPSLDAAATPSLRHWRFYVCTDGSSVSDVMARQPDVYIYWFIVVIISVTSQAGARLSWSPDTPLQHLAVDPVTGKVRMQEPLAFSEHIQGYAVTLGYYVSVC